MLFGERLRFKSRKGQWRKRAIAQIHKLHKLLDCPTSSMSTQQGVLDAAAKLARMGVTGERHLERAKALDFSDAMVHDIRMMLLIIVLLGRDLHVSGYPHSMAFFPKDHTIWSAREDYLHWSVPTRRQFQKLIRLVRYE